MVLGPIIPGRPTPAKPAGGTKAPLGGGRYVNTNSLAGIMAASKPKPAPVPRYIPSYATPGGKSFNQATASNNAAMAAGLIPKPTRSTKPVSTTFSSRGADVGGSSETGSIETKSAPTGGDSSGGSGAGKPLGVVLNQEEMDAVQSASDALRLFQENQAKAQLQTALGKIDRAAIDQYKGIANDFAARGMARSGGKLVTEQRAVAERDRSVNEATQAVTDFINELKLTGNLEQARINLSKSQAFQDYITGRLEPGGAGMGGTGSTDRKSVV